MRSRRGLLKSPQLLLELNPSKERDLILLAEHMVLGMVPVKQLDDRARLKRARS
jgi:hypothetical protein